jgi:NADH dehydrogenase
LPARGHVQVRVEELTPTKATLVTLAGHPLCGAIRFLSEQRGELLHFEVQVYDRPANLADWLVMRTVGDGLQGKTWESLVEAIAAESGGAASGPVQHEEEFLDDDQAERVEDWLKELIADRKRSQQPASRTARKGAGTAGASEGSATSEATI